MAAEHLQTGNSFVIPNRSTAELQPHPLIIPHADTAFAISSEKEIIGTRSFITDPIMGRTLVERYAKTAKKWQEKPTSENKTEIKRVLADLGVFMYLRGMPVYRHVRDEDGRILDSVFLDRTKAPSVRMGPNTSLQLLEEANITHNDIVGELFSGVGGLTIPTALRKPRAIYAIDKYTPLEYDLARTFNEAMADVLGDVTDEFKPKFTTPTFVQKDARELERADINFTVVLGDPPYGRDYANIFPEMPEADGLRIWVQALASLTEPGVSQRIRAYTVVPVEWIQTLRASIDNPKWTFKDAYGFLNILLQDNRYYKQRPDRVIRESTRPNTYGWNEMAQRIANFEVKPVKETSKFPLVIVHHEL